MEMSKYVIVSNRWKDTEQVERECEEIIKLIKSNPFITWQDVSEKLQIPGTKARSRLTRLSRRGQIRRIGGWEAVD